MKLHMTELDFLGKIICPQNEENGPTNWQNTGFFEFIEKFNHENLC